MENASVVHRDVTPSSVSFQKCLDAVVTVDGFKRLLSQKCSFCFSEAERREVGTAVMGPRVPIMLCTLLTDPDLLVERAATAAGDGGCESADGAASFKSGVWEHFGFPEAREEKEEKVTHRQEPVCRLRAERSVSFSLTPTAFF